MKKTVSQLQRKWYERYMIARRLYELAPKGN